jgi:hypothetical protein
MDMAKFISLGVLILGLCLLAVVAPLAVLGQNDGGASGVGCLDKDGDDLVGIAELFDLIDAYFDQTPWSELCPAPEPGTTPTDTAKLWIGLSQNPDLADYLRVRADTAFDVEAFDLDIFVDGTEYCNTSTMYADEGWYEMGCVFEEKLHTDVDRVSVQTSDYPDVLGDLRCARNDQSTADVTVFACLFR